MGLAEATAERQVRLKALRSRKFRNLDPQTRTLAKGQEHPDTVERDVAGVAEAIIEEDKERNAPDSELDIHAIAPKESDLKRALNKRLAVLLPKMQACVNILIRQRLATQKGVSSDLVGAMNVQGQADNKVEAVDSDEE